ncbi:MAG: sodium:calcium antiporter [Xanthomonadales bacterium]
MDFLLLITGLIGLWLGTELTIGGALAISRRLNLSEFFVGLVILSIGSDLPELAVATDAGITSLTGLDASGVVVGSSVGSVIAQIGFVLGIGAVISRLSLPRDFIYRHGAVLLTATVMLFVIALDGTVTRGEGLVLIVSYAVYVIALLRNSTDTAKQAPDAIAGGGLRSWVLLVVGLATVIMGSEVTVDSVISIAQRLQISEALIAVLIIGIGTSLPELSISISAILKRRTQMSVGNIIGSNILDTLLPIGIAAVISTVTIESQTRYFDIPFIFAVTVIVLGLFLARRGVYRPQGVLILSLYGVYVAIKLAQF